MRVYSYYLCILDYYVQVHILASSNLFCMDKTPEPGTMGILALINDPL